MKPSELLELHRRQVRAIAERHHVRNVRVFGSVVHGSDTDDSDLDLLVEPTSETTLMDIGAIRHELRVLMGIDVDVLTPRALPVGFRDQVLAEALPV
jgi:predicted nucleotidyltransferase